MQLGMAPVVVVAKAVVKPIVFSLGALVKTDVLERASRTATVHAATAGVMAIYELATLAIVFVPLMVLTTMVLTTAVFVALIAECRSRHREHEQQPQHRDGHQTLFCVSNFHFIPPAGDAISTPPFN